MPNWAFNQMYVTGPLADRDRFVDDMLTIETTDAGVATFYRIVDAVLPMPAGLKNSESPVPDSPDPHPNWAVMLANGDMTQEWYDELVASNHNRYNAAQHNIKEYGFASWYDWACTQWGTKWGDCETEVEHTADATNIRYETAWGPFSETFFETLAMTYPTLTFIHCGTEESNDYVFVAGYHNTSRHFRSSSVPDIDIEDYEDRYDRINEWECNWIDTNMSEVEQELGVSA